MAPPFRRGCARYRMYAQAVRPLVSVTSLRRYHLPSYRSGFRRSGGPTRSTRPPTFPAEAGILDKNRINAISTAELFHPEACNRVR
jgi:hypothetical protein